MSNNIHTTYDNEFGFAKEHLEIYLKNGLKFLYQGYEILKNKKIKTPYSLKKDGGNLENEIRDDICNEAIPLLEKAFLKDRDNEFLKFSFYNENRDTSDKSDIKRFDISLNYTSISFVKDIIIECKRLNKNTKNKAYIENGIERFEIDRYGYGLPLGGMIGFIEKGDENLIISNLEKRIKPKKTIIKNIHLINLENPIYDKSYDNHIYQSIHQRVGLEPIELYHLMMDFTSIIIE